MRKTQAPHGYSHFTKLAIPPVKISRTSIVVVIRPKKIRGMPDEMTSLAIHRKGEKKGMKREMKITQGME